MKADKNTIATDNDNSNVPMDLYGGNNKPEIESIQNDIIMKAEEKKYSASNYDTYKGLQSSGISIPTTDKVSFTNEGFNIKDAYTSLSDGSLITRYDDFQQGTDNEDRHARNQSTTSKWTNGLGKFVGKTLNNVVGGTLGTVYGAISAIAEGNWENVYDNSFYDLLDDYNTKMDNFSANYRKQEERDLNFFQSMGTANFWADDFLGGLSFMTGTIISESLWAAATGGSSLSTTMARTGLRYGKYFGLAKTLTNGAKVATEGGKKFIRGAALAEKTKWAKIGGKAGEVANLMRFTYTGAGFEAGMEARLYKKEQTDNFYRDFENLNGYKPTSEDIAKFNTELDSTTNMLWATNMALVGTSNFAILGKTFGVTSPFKTSSKYLNKKLFGTGITTEIAKDGTRGVSKAIQRTKLQRGLGFTTSILKNPFYEGIVEEGGQATASSAMENYLTSRYNPSKEAMGLVESMYDGFAHTYGTKEGWKEVGLGMLIGLIGGEGSNALSGQGLFTEARNAGRKQDGSEATKENAATGSVAEAENLNNNTGTKTVNRLFATSAEERILVASELQAANTALEKAEEKGDIMGIADAQSRIMLTSVKHANDFDYLDDQIADFETALKIQGKAEEGKKSKLAEHYNIEQNEVDGKITELVSQYSQLGQDYKSAKEFSDYMISDNPKELWEDATDIDVHQARQSIAYQMVMTKQSEANMEGAHSSLIEAVGELNPKLRGQFTKALQEYNILNRSSKKAVIEVNRLEQYLGNRKKEFDALYKRREKVNNKISSTPEGNKKLADELGKIDARILKTEAEISKTNEKLSKAKEDLAGYKEEMSDTSKISYRTRRIAEELDTIDPMTDEDLVDANTIEQTIKDLAKLDETIANSKNPQLATKIQKLAQEYKKGLDMWNRNAQTLEDLTNPELGLKRIGTMMQRKKQAGTTTLEFLKRLKQTQNEEQDFAKELEKNMKPVGTETVPAANDSNLIPEQPSNQDAVEDNKGDDILADKDLPNLSAKEINDIEKIFDVTIERNIEKGSYFVTGEDPIKVESAEGLIYSKQISKKNQGNNLIQNKIDNLKKQLRELVSKNYFLLTNFSNDENDLVEDERPTQKDLDRYQELRDKFIGDINKIVGKPLEKIGENLKKRSTFTDQDILEYQKLNTKLFNWRIVTGTNSNGLSIQDILDRIEKFESELTDDNTQPTKEQVIEMVDEANQEYSMGRKNTDFGQTMSYVNIGKDGESLELSHLSLDTLRENGFDVTFVKVENAGTKKDPRLVDVYRLEKDGEVIEIQKDVNKGNRLILATTEIANKFLKAMNLKVINYKLKTAWGYVFQNGELMKSDFGIEGANGEKLNPEEIYKLKPGTKLNFVVDIEDGYNVRDMIPLLNEGKIRYEEIQAKMAIYIKTENGETVALLKAGKDSGDTNFNRVRAEAFRIFKEKIENNEISIDDLADGNSSSQFQLPFQTEVEKVFIGTPNIKLNEDGSIVTYGISKEQADSYIVGRGYSENGNMGIDDKDVRKSFIPKDKNTPFVIIKQGDTKIAFPVALNPTSEIVLQKAKEIIESDKTDFQKETELIGLLKTNGVDPNTVYDSNEELDTQKVMDALEKSKTKYSKKDIKEMTDIEFFENSEIIIDLSEKVFVSPKVKMNLSKNLENTETKEKTSDKELSEKEFEDLLIKYKNTLAKAKVAKDVKNLVNETQDLALIEAFKKPKLKKQITEFALKNKVVPSISTEQMVEEDIKDTVDTEAVGVPSDINDEFIEEVEDIKQDPTEPKIKNLAKKLIRVLQNKYALVTKSQIENTDNLYHIPTSQTKEEMFELGFVRVAGDFYKKVDNKYTVEELINGLYEQYKKGTFPEHLFEFIEFKYRQAQKGNIIEGLLIGKEDFTNFMPKTLVDLYELYYNTQSKDLNSKKAIFIGNSNYLKEEFKGDFKNFIKNQRLINSDLYNDVLSQFNLDGPNILKDDLLSREKIDQYQEELGDFYNALLQYSIINKHIDLQENPKEIIFAEDFDDIQRINAVNNPNLPKPDSKIEIIDYETISINKSSEPFVQYKGDVYEKVLSDKQGNYVYKYIAKLDPNFTITEVATPFNRNATSSNTEVDTTKTNITTTEGSELEC